MRQPTVGEKVIACVATGLVALYIGWNLLQWL
jgi:hypothetical protein